MATAEEKTFESIARTARGALADRETGEERLKKLEAALRDIQREAEDFVEWGCGESE